MDSVSALIAGGMRTRFESLDMLANNMANSGTRGFKADRESYSLFMGEEAEGETGTTMPVIQKAWTDYSQGLLQPTGNALDLALNGKGFFAVNGPGGKLYTRNGSLEISAQGELQTTDGYKIRDTSGKAIKVDPALSLDIDKSGVVRQNGAEVAQLDIVQFARPETLAKYGRSYFAATAESGLGTRAVQTEVRQGQAENSNVASAESAVRLVGVMRQFEALQRAASLNSEMGKKVIDEVARVTSL